MNSWQEHLERWEQAGVIDAITGEKVRAFEAQTEQSPGQRWQVAVLLALGIILLVGGMMLFVASHWDDVSPWQRLALVIGFLAGIHTVAAVSATKFPWMATTLHGVGTAGSGAAILTVGSIFNMQEHWPTAILVWAICAALGWWLRRDQVQQVLTILLVAIWLVCEWSYWAEGYACTAIYIARMDAVMSAVMLTCFLQSRKLGVFWTLYVVGAFGLLFSIGMLSDGWTSYEMDKTLVPLGLRCLCACLIAAVCACVYWQRRTCLWPVGMVAALGYILPWVPQDVVHRPGYGMASVQQDGPGLSLYVLIGVACIGWVYWGLRMQSRAAVNYGIGGFAATVLWFYVSSLLDKFGRSLGLIGLGVLFIAGGWILEHFRRRLLSGLNEGIA